MTDRSRNRTAKRAVFALDMIFDDRKEDEDLPRGAIEAAIAAGEVTLDDILIAFRTKLIEALGGGQR